MKTPPRWLAALTRPRLHLRLWLRSLQHWPWLDTLRTLRLRFREDRLGVTASSLTFTTTIALVPLMTVMFAVFTAVPMFGTFRKALETYFIQNLVPDLIAKPVLSTLTQFAVKANRLGVLGLAFLGVTALALMLTIDRTLNGIWRVRQPRPLAQRVLLYWAVATLGPLLLGGSLTLTSYAISASRGLVSALPGGVALFLNLLELLLMAAGVTALFKFVPNTEVRWRHAWAGGAFVAIGFELAKRGIAWYLSAVPTYSTIYGAFATVPIFLVWLYLGWVIVLLGAVVAAYAPSLQMQVGRHPGTPGYRFSLALTLLGELAAARAGGQRGVGLMVLAEQLRLDPLQLEPIVEVLQQLDWVGRLDEAGAPRLVLLVDPARTQLAPLLSRLLLAPTPAMTPFWQQAGWNRMLLAEALPLASAVPSMSPMHSA
ncbi:MAG: YihY family inner membrane protein [Leptothrix sp. (in: b-proteobacteria)]